MLALVDCLLRSIHEPDASTALLGEALDCLQAIAETDPAFAEYLESQQMSAGSTTVSSWSDLLRTLALLDLASVDRGDSCGTDSSDADLRNTAYNTIRSAAHSAIRLREMQGRFSRGLEEAKLNAIYNFAYGISHELNNPLANISSRAGVLLPSLERADQKQLIQAIIDNAMRGCEMLGDLMLVARPPTPQPDWLDLESLAEEILKRGTHWASLRGVSLESIWIPLGTCRFDRSMFLELVWCVLRNAIEASQPGDRVTLSGNVDSSSLVVQIDDQGSGLSAQALGHCFDPYFSGREAGRGLGMGLAKAQRFAQLLGGFVTLENRAGRGCRATIQISVEHHPHSSPSKLQSGNRNNSSSGLVEVKSD